MHLKMQRTMKQQNEEELNLEQVVLDAYFSVRSNNDIGGGVYAKDDKTTQQIIDELETTMEVSEKTVVKYMVDHDYILKTDEDGTPIWQIYRMR